LSRKPSAGVGVGVAVAVADPGGPAAPGLGAPARQAVLAWGDASNRDLPWRHTRDPWAVLVAEVMCQQTQADRAAARFGPFMERFPTPQAAADAGVAAVVDAWAGLGYNRRAVALWRAAVACVSDHGGVVPLDLSALLALPGVGPYTARAVLAFAGGHDVGVVDTNVGRILARVAGRRLTPAEAQAAADASVPPGKGWEWNQAMLDVGAGVCTARQPRCGTCPLRRWCAWQGDPDRPDPAKGSAGVSGPQAPFDGSDRQGRGRLVDALRTTGSVSRDELAAVAGWPGEQDRATRVAASLIADGLAESDGGGGLRRPR
jgi:A/G-specific adenine glycosylase